MRTFSRRRLPGLGLGTSHGGTESGSQHCAAGVVLHWCCALKFSTCSRHLSTAAQPLTATRELPSAVRTVHPSRISPRMLSAEPAAALPRRVVPEDGREDDASRPAGGADAPFAALVSQRAVDVRPNRPSGPLVGINDHTHLVSHNFIPPSLGMVPKSPLPEKRGPGVLINPLDPHPFDRRLSS